MPYRFPGVDPYLEHPGLWRGVHTKLIAVLWEQLSPAVPANYWVDVEETLYVEYEDLPQRTLGPDVAISTQPSASRPAEATALLAPGFVAVEEVVEIPVRVKRLSIRQLPGREVVTVIEILSPTNKTSEGSGVGEYRRKRQEVLASLTNLVEIDLLRTGVPLPGAGHLPPHDYAVFVHRAWERPRFWGCGWNLPDPIPAVPIPLRPEDQTLLLDLGNALRTVYERGAYERVIDYARPVVPPLAAGLQTSARGVVPGDE
ncbi:MAG: DUF4058 family protein [Planctomycetes bacterium]|nr:DUF4058 family protein [Planctomycetota bacterium]